MKMKKTYTVKIGSKIKKERQKIGYTQKQLAEKIGITTRHISDIELNRTQASYDVLMKICNELQITPNEIFEEYIQRKGGAEKMYSIEGAINYLKKIG